MRLSRLLLVVLLAVSTIGDTVSAYPVGGSGVVPPGGSGASPTPQPVTSATVLTGAADIVVFITASFSGEITLPAASAKAGQVVTIIDKAGVCSGDANGASENLIYLEVSNTGTETITAPNLAGSLTRMLCWKRYASVTLVSDGTSAWAARERMYWHIDPRSISGLEAWYDSRRGITLNSSTVSAWGDLSGGNVDLAQGTAGAQPAYSYTTSSDPNVTAPENYVAFSSVATADSLQSSVTPAFTSDSLTAFGTYSRNWTDAAGAVNEVLIASVETANLGFSWFVRMASAVGPSVANDWYIRGSGTNNGDPTRAGPKHWDYSWHRVNETALLGATPQRTIVRFDTQFNAAVTGVQAAVPDFTQALVMGNTTLNARVHMVAVYDAALTITEILNMELAMQEVWPQF